MVEVLGSEYRLTDVSVLGTGLPSRGTTMWSMVGEYCPLQWGTAPVRVLASHHSIAAIRKCDKCHVTGDGC